MNTHELCQTIKDALIDLKWTGGSYHVFASGSCIISPMSDDVVLPLSRVPIALIKPMDATVDPEFGEEPNLLQRTIIVRVVTLNAGDATGEKTLMGGSKVSGALRSQGKGILEISGQIMKAIKFLNINEGVQIQFSHASEGAGGLLDSISYVGGMDFFFTAWIVEEE